MLQKPQDQFFSAAGEPIGCTAEQRQKQFIEAFKTFLSQADMASSRYIINVENSEADTPFFEIQFFDDNFELKASLTIILEQNKNTIETKISVRINRPEFPADNLLYFVDVKDLIGKAARRYTVNFCDKIKGIFDFEPVVSFDDVKTQFTGFMIDVENRIYQEPPSVQNPLRIKPQKLIRVPTSPMKFTPPS